MESIINFPNFIGIVNHTFDAEQQKHTYISHEKPNTNCPELTQVQEVLGDCHWKANLNETEPKEWSYVQS